GGPRSLDVADMRVDEGPRVAGLRLVRPERLVELPAFRGMQFGLVPRSDAALQLGQKEGGHRGGEGNALVERVSSCTLEQGSSFFEATQAEQCQPERDARALEVWNPVGAIAFGAHAGERALDESGRHLSGADLDVRQVDESEQRQFFVAASLRRLEGGPDLGECRCSLSLEGTRAEQHVEPGTAAVV